MCSYDCNDYSKLTVRTGIANLTTANPNLDGTGIVVPILTSAGVNGMIVKSVVIKATQATETGMVRLFVIDTSGAIVTLVREIKIPTQPYLSATPTPAPVLPTAEIVLDEPIFLKTGYKLYASTQYAQTINVIAEGLDKSYPAELPTTCCNFKQTTEVTGNQQVDVANPNLDGSGTIVPIFTATGPNSGALIRSITISALASTHQGMVRLFVSPAGPPTYSLLSEVFVPESQQSSFEPSFKVKLYPNYNLEQNFVIGASTNNGDPFAITIEGQQWSYPI